MERIATDQEERDWLHWLKQVRDGEMTQRQAADRMKVTDRWARELLNRYERVGDRVVNHVIRGRRSYDWLERPRAQPRASVDFGFAA